MKPLFYWRKLVRCADLERWTTELAQYVSADRVATLEKPGSRSLRLEAYMDTRKGVARVQEHFGGQIGQCNPSTWLAASAIAPATVLRFGQRLLVCGDPDNLAELRAKHPHRVVLCIPAAMAFGTGQHATTAMCLRYLMEFATVERAGGPDWSALDLGSGSGVLALAARGFGAGRALGVDNDPHAVRTAKENARINAIRGVRFQRVDLLQNRWPATVGEAWPLITANLFSEMLIALMPRIAAVLAPGGTLIASGVLATQSAEVERAIHSAGLHLTTTRRRGKWVAYLVEKPVSNPASSRRSAGTAVRARSRRGRLAAPPSAPR